MCTSRYELFAEDLDENSDEEGIPTQSGQKRKRHNSYEHNHELPLLRNPNMCHVKGYGGEDGDWEAYWTTIEKARAFKQQLGPWACITRLSEGGWELNPDISDPFPRVRVRGVMRCVVGFQRWLRRAREKVEVRWAPGGEGANWARDHFEGLCGCPES